MSEFVYGQGDARVTRNDRGAVTGNASDLERRIRVRMAEAEDAALQAKLRIGDPTIELEPDEVGRLGRLALAHEQLAEALREVLEGEF